MAYVMKHEVDARQEILKAVGDISNFNVFHNQVLIAIYIRPEMTAGGIIITNKTRDEDKWQGKVGLVLKKGPSAFVDESNQWFIFFLSQKFIHSYKISFTKLIDFNLNFAVILIMLSW